MRSRLTTRLSMTAALGLVLAVAPSLARAGDDDVPFDTKIFRSIMGGLGLQRGDEPQINYQERSPLVIPPSADLPPPVNSDAVIAANPAWPKDPDISRAKAQSDLEKTRDIEAERMREENPLRPDQLAPGARTNPALARRPSTKTVDNVGDRKMSPSELGYTGNLFGTMFSATDDREVTRFTAEPPRAALTDPPAGYRVPSPDQPYTSGKTKSAPKATDFYSTHGEVNSNSR